MSTPPQPKSTFVTAQDGLLLHALEFGSRASALKPVVCLPGFSRTAEDFTTLASALAAQGRRVMALDSRGRGHSQFDPDPAKYSLAVELADLITLLTAAETMPAVLVGSSRGGLLIMLLAAARPAAIAGAILNDIGPVIETSGLLRIKGYVGKLPLPRSLQEGAEILRRTSADQFPKLTDADWLSAAGRTWRQSANGLALTYDPRLADAFAAFSPDAAPPPIWGQFDALAQTPLMVVRGANSDILSAATVAAMRARRERMESIEVRDQGHTPLLAEADVIARIAAFVSAC
ncbi:MAG TPA: alpha/beta hydrolase [Xanthobacteraceae bacterium]|jgi:pimeloyl-ACP methyl ester carboxylesterase|nr:alpha/beta hydrolase [Xanthobacteraceae bacterium]